MSNNLGDYYDNYGSKNQSLKKGYSFSDTGGQKVFTQKGTKGKTGGIHSGGKDAVKSQSGTTGYSIYKIPKASAPAPAPPPPPPPKPQPKPEPKPEPVKHSPEIEQAKERVNKYQEDILSGKTSEDIYGQAQATVQSSFIKPTSSNVNNQIDFSANTFEAKESSVPNEQAQAAQNQMQNFISKYSKYKSSN